MAGSQKLTGTVKWFSGQKGFGFVAPDDGGEDLFVHQTEIRSDGFRTLREGQRVEFTVDTGEDGRSKAVDVVSLAAGSFRSGGGGGRGWGFGGRGGFGGGGGYGRYGGGGGGYGRGGGRRGGYGGGGGGGVECYNCGGIGHLARECYRGGGSGGSEWGYGGGRGGGGRGGRGYVEGQGGGGRGYGGGGRGGACYNCGEVGHFARDCPNEQN